MTTAAAHGRGGLATHKQQICCDVLDAWFDPSPAAQRAFTCSGTAMRASPDLQSRELIEAIANTRNLNPNCISLGAGSSEVIHRVLPGVWGDGHAVILDPTYSEYPYLLKREGRSVRSMRLAPKNDFRADFGALKAACKEASVVILVNPNNPTGQRLTREEILELKSNLAHGATLWIDEAYVDYCPEGTSVEQDACEIEGLFVLKSLSKAYALSGIRAAYLVSCESVAQRIFSRTPPWIIGTAAQSAAAAALRDQGYYMTRWRESSDLVREFADALRRLGLRVYSGYINAVLVEVPQRTSSLKWASQLATVGLAVRTPEGMGLALRERYVRISVLDRSAQAEVLARLKSCM